MENILNCFGFSGSKASPTPFDPSLKLRKNIGEGINQLRYTQILVLSCVLLLQSGLISHLL
jgi:hypothetical protein